MVRFAPLAALALAVAPAARAADLKDPKDIPPEPGVYWETSVEIEMPGLPFAIPPQKSKACLPKKGQDEQPPAQGNKDQKCQMTDMKKSGSRMTWKMKCEDGSTGEGDITWEKDSYAGTMSMRQKGRDMNMKMSGKKLGGDCDASEMKRQVATMKKQADDRKQDMARQQAQQCDEAAETAKLSLFESPVAKIPPLCPDTSKLCAKLETRKGLLLLKTREQPPDAREKAEKLCKKDYDPVVEKYCSSAEKEHAQGKTWDADTVEFVFGYCKALSKALSKKECAGRSYTAMPPAQRAFCVGLAEGRIASSGDNSGTGKAQATKRAQRATASDDEDAPKKVEKKRSAGADDEEEAPKADMKSKIMKGLLPF
jgi:hypothetical protein